MSSDEQKAASSYIVSFYENVQSLNQQVAYFYNLMAEIFAKGENLEEHDKENLHVAIQNVRYFVILSYQQLQGLVSTLEEPSVNMQTVQKHVKTLREHYELNQEALDYYIKTLNAFLLNSVIRDLMKRAQDVVDDIYGES